MTSAPCIRLTLLDLAFWEPGTLEPSVAEPDTTSQATTHDHRTATGHGAAAVRSPTGRWSAPMPWWTWRRASCRTGLRWGSARAVVGTARRPIRPAGKVVRDNPQSSDDDPERPSKMSLDGRSW